MVVQSEKFEGKLERVVDGQFKGWVIQKARRDRSLTIDVFLDGTLLKKVKNNGRRQDLRKTGKSSGIGGFSFSIPKLLLNQPVHNVELRFQDGSLFEEARVKGEKTSIPFIPAYVPIGQQISIIVPIFNALKDLIVCIKRLKNYTSQNVDVILIDDASTDGEVIKYLGEGKFPENFRVFYNKTNLGFTKTINYGIELAGDNDVVLLNSDARVTPRWLDGLKRAVAMDFRIATVTPMSDRAGAFSAPNIGNENELPSGVREEEFAIAFRRRSIGSYPVVPTGNGFCMYIRRAAIKHVGLLDEDAFPKGYGEENDFCMRAQRSGWFNVVDDRTYVFHDRNKSFGSQREELLTSGRKIIDQRYPEYIKATKVFKESTIIETARFCGRLALGDVIATGASIKPRVLYVISTLTGGTPQTNRDLMLAMSDRIEPWLLHCDSRIISLYKVSKDGPDSLIERVEIFNEVEFLTHTSPNYDRVLSSFLRNYDFALVHIRHIAWHSLNLPRIAREAGAKVICSFHDYYAMCPTVKLLDENNVFCGGSCTKTGGDCKVDLWKDKSKVPPLKDKWVYHWRKMFKEKVFPYCDAFVTTHDSVKRIYEGNFGELNNFYVIPHGRDFERFVDLSSFLSKGERLRVLVPGNLSVAKGRKIIFALARINCDIEFHILGRSTKADLKNLRFYGEYERKEFLRKVKSIRPHVGMVMSLWNETWCHTLTESWAVGLPVIVSDFSTLADRVNSAGAGWVVSLDISKINQLLRNIISNPILLEKKKRFVKAWQKEVGATQNTNNMASSYYDLYRTVIGTDVVFI